MYQDVRWAGSAGREGLTGGQAARIETRGPFTGVRQQAARGAFRKGGHWPGRRRPGNSGKASSARYQIPGLGLVCDSGCKLVPNPENGEHPAGHSSTICTSLHEEQLIAWGAVNCAAAGAEGRRRCHWGW